MSMKKHGWLSVLASFILIVRCVCSASAVEQLPEEIRNVLSGAEITHSAFWDGPGSTWLVVIRTPDQTNTLVCFEQHDNRWIQRFHTNTAVPQGNVGVKLIHITDKVQDFVYNRTSPGPVLMILMDDGSYTSYQRSDSGQWNLFKVFYQNEQVYLDFEDESIIYRTPIDQDHSKFETVYGNFERDLRKTDLNSIPRTPVQAQKMFEEMRNGRYFTDFTEKSLWEFWKREIPLSIGLDGLGRLPFPSVWTVWGDSPFHRFGRFGETPL